ncbi:MAG: glycosyltransferase [Planctomycetota bacterium]|jgi:glycosyltransferase involved in cell wall biosynthesis
MGFEVVCCVALNDPAARNHLLPIAQHPSVTRLWIVRHKEIDLGQIPKAEYVLVKTRFKLWRFVQMIWVCLRLGRKEQVKAFVSFNPIPYGLFSFIAARLYRKKIHFGFIGSDWNIYVKKKWGRFLLPILRKADLITVTGKAMREEMIQYRFKSQNVRVLPHGTDLEKFSVADIDNPRYSCIFVGRLIELKRVNVILQAWAEIIKSHPQARLCIAGDGPAKFELVHEADQLGIAKKVDFVGNVSDVQSYLAVSKILVMASRHEGFPFALIEGICCGLVPISTPVGSIPDTIIDGENGLLFPVDDVSDLAKCIKLLLDDDRMYERLRKNVLELRPQFSHENVAGVWDTWFKEFGAGSDELKVLHVAAALDCGGTETRLMELLRYIDRDKVHFDFCVHKKHTGYYEQAAVLLGSKVLRCGPLKNLPVFCRRFYRLLKRSDYDVVHSHTLSFSAICLTLAKWAGVKKRVAHFRNMIDPGEKSIWDRVTRKLAIYLISRNATDIIGITRGVLKNWFGPDWQKNPKIHQVYNGIDIDLFQGDPDPAWLKQEFDIPSGHKTIVHVGSFRPEKNHAKLVSIAQKYLTQHGNTSFILVGDGLLRPTIEASVKSKGISDRFRFVGVRSDVARIMRSADAFLFPSSSEGLGNVVLEAIAADLPMVVSDLEPIREVLEICGSAQILSVDAPDAQWAGALATAINIPRRQQWLEQIKNSPFALPNAWRQWLDIYRG